MLVAKAVWLSAFEIELSSPGQKYSRIILALGLCRPSGRLRREYGGGGLERKGGGGGEGYVKELCSSLTRGRCSVDTSIFCVYSCWYIV